MYPAIGAQLAQSRPSGTSAVELYAAPSTQAVEVTSLIVCNTTGAVAKVSVFHDDAGGDTFDQTTALYYQSEVPGNSTLSITSEQLGTGIVLSPLGQIGVQTDTADALTFTLYGAVESRAPGVGP